MRRVAFVAGEVESQRERPGGAGRARQARRVGVRGTAFGIALAVAAEVGQAVRLRRVWPEVRRLAHAERAHGRGPESVGSGDPKNVEAQAARRYWPLLMGKDFRRDRDEAGTNAMLNYGYTVLRSLCARSVIAAGLHPTIGIHHANRTNAFALADDLIEPLRPLVDALTVRLIAAGHLGVIPETKRAFASLIAHDLPGENGTTTISGAAIRMAQSLAACFVNKSASDFILPIPPSPAQLSGLALLVK